MSWGIRVLSSARLREHADEHLRLDGVRLAADNERLTQQLTRANQAFAAEQQKRRRDYETLTTLHETKQEMRLRQIEELTERVESLTKARDEAVQNGEVLKLDNKDLRGQIGHLRTELEVIRRNDPGAVAALQRELDESRIEITDLRRFVRRAEQHRTLCKSWDAVVAADAVKDLENAS